MPPPGQREASSEDAESNGHRRKAILLFIVLFLLALTGAYALVSSPTEPVPGGLYEATGDLTVTVENQQGKAVAGKEVALAHPETGKVVASGTTDDDGQVTFRNVEQAKYEVRVDGKTHKVSLTSEEESITVGVTVTPPKSHRSRFS